MKGEEWMGCFTSSLGGGFRSEGIRINEPSYCLVSPGPLTAKADEVIMLGEKE